MQNMMIYYFSGTGNTKKITKLFAEALEECGAKAEIRDIVACEAPATEGYDAVGIAYPVHGFNTPEIVTDFAKKLPCGNGKPLFALKTSGEPLRLNDASSLELSRIAESKGYRFIGERHYVMPYNMIFRHSDAMVKHMVTYMRKLVPLHVSSILAKRTEGMRLMPFSRIVSSVLRIEWLYAKLQGPTMRAGDSCTGCGLCARRCPMGNITVVNGRPVFGRNCSLCVRCSFSCPVDAISIGLLNGWRVNEPYEVDRIMADQTIPDTIPIEKLPRLYRKYYREADAMLGKRS